jgi:hypothetical protein
MQCGIADVNGDGIVDRIVASSVMLGTGDLTSGSFFTPGAILTLPGPFASRQSTFRSTCNVLGSDNFTYTVSQTAGLRDLTADGTPDYLTRNSAGTWQVSIGTGTGFASPISISGVNFALSSASARCAGSNATTASGVIDLNGDGRVDVLSDSSAYQLVGSDGVPGAPSAGRLAQTDNGFGATTTISYRSIKADGGLHQVPFHEVVVDSVATTGTKGLGGTLSAVRYAYGGAELVFDPALDAFTFPGYRRRVVLPTPVGQPARSALPAPSASWASARRHRAERQHR